MGKERYPQREYTWEVIWICLQITGDCWDTADTPGLVASGHFRETVQPVATDPTKSLSCLYAKWFPPLSEQLLTMPFPQTATPSSGANG